MPSFELKSVAFRREREKTWQELEALVRKAEQSGIGALNFSELFRLPTIYRATLSALSVARAISLDRNLLLYLENLGTRAFVCVYGGHSRVSERITGFFLRDFPSAVRAAWTQLAIAFAVLLCGFLAAYVLTMGNVDWFYTFVSEGYAGTRKPTASAETLRSTLYSDHRTAHQLLQAFAAFLFTHNAKIGILCFTLGFAFGIPVFILLFLNGTVLGSFVALFAHKGLAPDLWAWLLIHGTTEILAVLLCAAAGLVLGSALAFPGRLSRLDSLAVRGRQASLIIIGAVLMFSIASLLEGFGRQLVTDMTARYLIGGTALVLWILYFVFVGRRRRHGNR